ncbi:MBL fold metallo-hydrolase [Streptococcus merionis]|uniref:MBL fold metallo-hydrolase n=1 Tax=Streptococcus merionis TaxID=400065 RepID=UPI0026EDE54E|nr:MBL fold metallo-hydrolase [Streptococcus merionis]
MNIIKIVNDVARENTYILENDSHVLVIDPGSNRQTIQNKLNQLNKPVAAILLTHTHYDHIMSLDAIYDAFGQPDIYVAEEERDWLVAPELNLSGLSRHDDMADVIIKAPVKTFGSQQPYDLEGFEFTVVPTPGHSIGGVSFVFEQENCVLTGDALFRESIGRTDLFTGSLSQLKESIITHLFTLPKHYTVHPGHGQNTTIAHEKTFNPWFH